jgi:hypothetical protein
MKADARVVIVATAHIAGLIVVFVAVGLASACSAPLPDELADYRTRCVRMNDQPLPEAPNDPHVGRKNVYACDVPAEDLAKHQRPFPDGTTIVKEAFRDGEDFNWLIAAAQKRNGRWRWNEWTRNFADEEFRHILAGESVCTGCHQRVQSLDWIFTFSSR